MEPMWLHRADAVKNTHHCSETRSGSFNRLGQVGQIAESQKELAVCVTCHIFVITAQIYILLSAVEKNSVISLSKVM